MYVCIYTGRRQGSSRHLSKGLHSRFFARSLRPTARFFGACHCHLPSGAWYTNKRIRTNVYEQTYSGANVFMCVTQTQQQCSAMQRTRTQIYAALAHRSMPHTGLCRTHAIPS